MTDFAASLIADIRAQGSITVEDYMARCNAHYYATRDPLGAMGDFTTAPEISQIFGELVGAWAMDIWTRAGSPDDVILVELGPGRGTLMADLLRAVPPLAAQADVFFVETSPALTKRQAECVPAAQWSESLSALPRGRAMILIANEFFDALPVRQFVGETERSVIARDRLSFCPEGNVTREDNPASQILASEIAGRLVENGGAALIVDYGYAGEERGDTLQAVRWHDHVKPLSHPGDADLTAHVDFQALIASAAGAGTHGPVTQAAFLSALGIGLRAETLMQRAGDTTRDDIAKAVHRLTAPNEMGALFKVLALTGKGWPIPAGFPA